MSTENAMAEAKPKVASSQTLAEAEQRAVHHQDSTAKTYEQLGLEREQAVDALRGIEAEREAYMELTEEALKALRQRIDAFDAALAAWPAQTEPMGMVR